MSSFGLNMFVLVELYSPWINIIKPRCRPDKNDFSTTPSWFKIFILRVLRELRGSKFFYLSWTFWTLWTSW